jgi:cysteinyl-tRNA synthetase
VLGIIELAERDAFSLESDFAVWVEGLVAEREDARKRRDFARADAIRAELTGKGIVVEDTSAGPRWKKA